MTPSSNFSVAAGSHTVASVEVGRRQILADLSREPVAKSKSSSPEAAGKIGEKATSQMMRAWGFGLAARGRKPGEMKHTCEVNS